MGKNLPHPPPLPDPVGCFVRLGRTVGHWTLFLYYLTLIDSRIDKDCQTETRVDTINVTFPETRKG